VADRDPLALAAPAVQAETPTISRRNPVFADSTQSLPAVQAGTRLVGRPDSGRLQWFAEGIERVLRANGHMLLPEDDGVPSLVLNFTSASRPRSFRRKTQGTFVVSVVEVDRAPEDVLREAYPVLVRSLSNLLIYLVNTPDGVWRTYFITMEQGWYAIDHEGNDQAYFEAIYNRLEPLANSSLVINNIFVPDLSQELWQGNDRTRALREAGQRLERMNLLPTPFPIHEFLSERSLAHVKKLFGIGGLSYGNLSVRHDERTFWMSASGVNKGKLDVVGRDILLIADFDREHNAMVVRVPPHVEPRRASVDAIEHWKLYTEHPRIGAIIHVHAWMEGVRSTTVNYPCGTAELATEVADLVRLEPDPSRAVIGLKNHGLTITGTDLEDIFSRIDGRLLPQVPME
jgi:ribulose-5-phosphate 4-epimerase/fuculose-1-phosphate aldolase